MIEKAAHRDRRVGGGVLVERRARKSFVHQPRRGHRGCRHQYVAIRETAPDSLDQRQNRERFANAGGMYPHQRAGGPWGTGPTHPFAKALWVFFAAHHPRAQIQAQRGPRRAGQYAIEAEAHRAASAAGAGGT